MAPGEPAADGGNQGATVDIPPAPAVPRELPPGTSPSVSMGDGGRVVQPLLPGRSYRAGDFLVISGTTILSAGNHVSVEVAPLAFGPARKGESLPVSGVSGVVPVIRKPGEVSGTWSFAFDTGGWEEGEYIVSIRGIEVSALAYDFKFSLTGE